MKSRHLRYLAVLLTSSTLWAQDAPSSTPPPLPPGPLIQERAPQNSQWLITTIISGTGTLNDQLPGADAVKAAKKGSTTKVMVTKTGKIYRVEHLDEHSQLWTIWAQGATQIMVWPDRKSAAELAVSANPDAPNPFMTDFSTTDFPGFGWLALKDYTAIKTYKGFKCIVFREERNLQSDDPEARKLKQTITAYIDFDTRLPVGLVDGEQVNLFDWKPAPKGALTLPPSVQGILDQRQKAAEHMSQTAARPF